MPTYDTSVEPGRAGREGGEGGSFWRRFFATPDPSATSLPAAKLLLISLALSAVLVGFVTFAVTR